MSDRRIDFGTLSIKDYAIGVGLLLVAMAVIYGFEMLTDITLPSLVASAVGAAIGVAAWFFYLFKRKS